MAIQSILKGKKTRTGSSQAANCQSSQPNRSIHVCILGTAYHLDGQKSIWIQQVAKMNNEVSGFNFTWILTTSGAAIEGPVYDILRALPRPPQFATSPFEAVAVSLDDIHQRPGTLSYQ
jgi:hypothetical protein